MKQRRRFILSAGIICSLCLALLLVFTPNGFRHPPQAHAAGTAARPGGINVEPSMRPWAYLGANPDSWWDPTHGQAFIDAEMPLIQALGVKTLRVEFPLVFVGTQ